MLDIAFIGAGNMVTHIIQGLINSGYSANKIIATNRHPERLKLLKKYHIEVCTNNQYAVEKAEIVVLGVKPYAMKQTLTTILPILHKKRIPIVSIAAGIKLETLCSWYGAELPVMRMMPNLPIAINQGVCVWCANKWFSELQLNHLRKIFSPTGIWQQVAESQIDIVTALAGSGPAYFYRFVELLAQKSSQLGLDKKVADDIALQTGLGSLKLLQKSETSTTELIKRVTSPRGTTEIALNELEKLNFPQIIATILQVATEHAAKINDQVV